MATCSIASRRHPTMPHGALPCPPQDRDAAFCMASSSVSPKILSLGGSGCVPPPLATSRIGGRGTGGGGRVGIGGISSSSSKSSSSYSPAYSSSPSLATCDEGWRRPPPSATQTTHGFGSRIARSTTRPTACSEIATELPCFPPSLLQVKVIRDPTNGQQMGDKWATNGRGHDPHVPFTV